jgi:hypothetical protein
MTTLKLKYGAENGALLNAKYRCFDPKNSGYIGYGGRGITVCEEWMGKDGFERFLEHIGPKPSPDLSLDRIDNDGNYEPGNVRWATDIEQANNKRKYNSHRDSLRITSNGETLTVNEWARKTGLDPTTIRWRMRQGMSGDALVEPPNPAKVRRKTMENSIGK